MSCHVNLNQHTTIHRSMSVLPDLGLYEGNVAISKIFCSLN